MLLFFNLYLSTSFSTAFTAAPIEALGLSIKYLFFSSTNFTIDAIIPPMAFG